MFLSHPPLLFVLSLVALAYSPVTFFVRLDYYTLGIIEALSFVVICPQRSYCLKINTDFFFCFALGLNSQSGAADVCDSKAGADLLDIILRKVCLFLQPCVCCIKQSLVFLSLVLYHSSLVCVSLY